MSEQNPIKKESALLKRLPGFVLLCLFAVALFHIFTYPYTHFHIGNIQSVESFEDGWVRKTNAGEEPVFTNIPFHVEDSVITIRHEIPAFSERDYDTLVFESLGQCIIVTADGELIYSLNSEKKQSDLLRIYAPCIVELPSLEEPFTLEISYSRIQTKTLQLPDIYAGTYSAIARGILYGEMPILIGFGITLVLFVLLVVVFIFFSIRGIVDSRCYSLAGLILCISVWICGNSPIIALTGSSLEKAHLFSALGFMMLPLFILSFTKTSIDKSRALSITSWVVYGELALQLCNLLLRILSVQKLLPLTHATMAAILLVAFISARTKWKKEFSVSHRYIAYAVLSLLIPLAVTLILYWLLPSFPYELLTLIGLIIFIFGLFFTMLGNVSKTLLENEKQMQHITLYKQFAMYDSLTGLDNRRSFEHDLKKIAEDAETKDAVLIMLDLNGLKVTNDAYGHRAGDNLIIASADMLRKAYQNHGNIYRIGGDEFAVIITDGDMDTITLEAALQKELNRYNEKTLSKLSIARGFSRLLSPEGRKLSVNEWKQAADLMMYADKRSKQAEKPSEAEELREIIHGVIEILEARDSYTANHSGRVAKISTLIAEKLGLSDKTVTDIRSAAEMHDIGKIAISEAILLKPDRLTDLEYNSMKQHPVIGASIISNAESMTEIAQIIRHHHERYDGKGYPDQLSGDDIPIGARIIAIADSIDAMTSKRCYRDALPLDVCLEEVKKNLNKMYDPAIGKIVIDHWDEIVELLEQK